MIKGLTISEQECLKTFSKTKPKRYQSSSIKELVSELSLGKDIALCLPTGTGKTFVYLPITITAANRGYRVCILVATNLIMDQVRRNYLPNFKTNVQPYYAKGIEHYDCPLTNDIADYGTCTAAQRLECSKKNSKCMVLHTNTQLEDHNFIITNFHKFLSVPTKRGFDLIVIDDSHGFENAQDDKFQTRVSYYEINGAYKRHEQKGDVLSDFAGEFLDFFDDGVRTVPHEELTRRAPDDVIKKIAEIKSYDRLQKDIKNLEEPDRSTCYNLLYFVRCCQNASLHTFYIQKDYYNPDDPQEASLIARKSDKFQSKMITSLFNKSKVIFATATPGDIAIHAGSCTHRDYNQDSLAIVPQKQPSTVKNWFKGLTIFETSDVSGDARDSVENGAHIASEILKSFRVKTLLLFKNYRDQKKAEIFLKKNADRDITFIDDGFQTETVQELVEKADVIMATASSRLWEGIDIRNLKLEMIFSLPFIRPPVHLDKSKSFQYVKRKMLVRLQQGIGRLIRKENDCGVCVIMDNRLDKYKNSSNFSESYRQRITNVSTDNLCREVERILGVT